MTRRISGLAQPLLLALALTGCGFGPRATQKAAKATAAAVPATSFDDASQVLALPPCAYELNFDGKTVTLIKQHNPQATQQVNCVEFPQ